MQKILISACLLGEKVTYDERSNFLDNALIKQWLAEGRIVPACPETLGGLPTPRPAAYIVGIGGGGGVFDKTARVLVKDGTDVTSQFTKGADRTLALIKQHNIKIAIMKERSPSCGSNEIYEGDFSGNKTPGSGVAAALLKRHGVAVFSENDIDKVAAFLKELESKPANIIPPRPQ
jgi:uncharacterized protein YbbK (DUF523 family)